MALNYSHWPVFPAHTSEDNLVSPMRVANGYLMDDVPNMNGEGYLRSWPRIPGEVEERNLNYSRERADLGSSQDSTSDDIVDLLPSDPFGMDIQTTFTAITGWFEYLELGYGGYMQTDDYWGTQEGYSLFAEWNMICNNSFKFQLFPHPIQVNEKLNVESFPSSSQVYENPCVGQNYIPGSEKFDEKLKIVSKVEERGTGVGLPPFDNEFRQPHTLGNDVTVCSRSASCSSELGSGEKLEIAVGLAPFDNGFHQPHNSGNDLTFCNGSASCSSELGSGEELESAANFDRMPHEALGFALKFVGLKDLLSVERVCKSLLTTVRGDTLLWRTIRIERNERITDDALVQLVSRAQGNLQCLNLVECSKVTDNGLRRILETNPRLTKLCIPGCTRISIEGVVNLIKDYNSNVHVGGIKSLRIGGLYGVNNEHFEELKLSLGVDEKKFGSDHKPHFYHGGNSYLPYDDDRSIDIEMCPRCKKLRLVYDCPAEGCKVKDKSPQVCRACTFCIARCTQCGRCFSDTEFQETFCLDLLCSDCYKLQLNHQVKLDKTIEPSEVIPVPSYHICHNG